MEIISDLEAIGIIIGFAQQRLGSHMSSTGTKRDDPYAQYQIKIIDKCIELAKMLEALPTR